MRPRLLASAAAALTAAIATAADPLPIPIAGSPPAATAPAALPIPIPSYFAPTVQEKKEGTKPPTPMPTPVVPPAGAPAPLPEAHAPADCSPLDGKCLDDHLGPWNTVWVRGGYSYVWIKDAPTTPPLLSTGPAAANSRTLLGGGTTSYGGFNAVGIDGGMWLNERHTVGLSFGGFIAEKRSVVSSLSSDALGSPLLVRPFFNAALGGSGGQDSFIVSAPGRFAGALAVEQGARIDGYEVNLLLNTGNTCSWTTNFIAGFRYFDLDEYQTVYQSTASLTGNTIPFFGGPPVNGVAITDRVRTRNQFYGAQFGGEGEYRFGPLFIGGSLKAALGPNHQITEVSGQTLANGAGGPGGFLAVGAIPNGNIGRTTTNNFAVLADATANVGIQVSNHIRIGFGYQFLYLNNVVRPSHQITTTIDPRLVPTAASYGGVAPSNTTLGGPGTPPLTPLDRDDFFAHGLRFTFELQY